MGENKMVKMIDILFDLWYGRYDNNEETAVYYN